LLLDRAVTAPPISILGVPVAVLDARSALAEVARLAERAGPHGPHPARPARVVYVNAHTLNLAARDPEYRAVLGRAHLVLNDGAGVALAARLHGRRFPANLNGTDFNPRVLELAAARGWRVFFLGGRPGVAAAAAERLGARIPGLEIVGTRDGYAPTAARAVLRTIRVARPDLVMVGLGNPHQERWLDLHLGATGARLGVGVGGFFDFAAGRVPRAPAPLRRLGLEWTYRLAQEPRRLWRRYLVGNPAFLARVLWAWLAAREGPAEATRPAAEGDELARRRVALGGGAREPRPRPGWPGAGARRAQSGR
jgi:N-acetylglucosaminyldiphosphoundecaprenol N-acetyl-beta-D-mannosaminyltransferase